MDLARLNAFVTHIKRSANKAADVLAKEGVSRQSLFIFYVWSVVFCPLFGVGDFFPLFL